MSAVLALLLAAAAAPAQGIEIVDVFLEMNPRHADILMKKESYDRSSFAVTVRDGDAALPGRIEVKGSSSRFFRKKSLLVKMDGANLWRGHHRMVFNAMATDLSAMREWMSWDLARSMGLPVPDTFYARVHVNGAPLGLFFFIEWIDPEMLAARGLGDDGQFFHPPDGDFCGDLTPASLESGDCYIKIAPGDGDMSALVTLIEEVEATPAETFHTWLDERFDSRGVIDWIALNTITSMGDTYNKNYFLYLSAVTGKWHVVPWDYDFSFGRNGDPDLPWPETLFNSNYQYWYPEFLGMPNPLKDKVIANPVLRDRLVARLKEITGKGQGSSPAAGWAEPAALSARVAALEEAISPVLAADSYFGSRLEEHADHVGALHHYAHARVGYLEEIVYPDNPSWVADTASAPMEPGGEPIRLVDGWGRTLASLTPLEESGGFVSADVVKGEPPDDLPPGVAPEACVMRQIEFYALLAGTVEFDVVWGYEQENSRLTEVGAGVGDERGLVVFVHDGLGWQPLATEVNPYANLLTVRGLPLPAGGTRRLIACVPGA